MMDTKTIDQAKLNPTEMDNQPQTSLKTAAKGGSIYINGDKYPLPRQVVENIEAIIGLEAKQERNTPFHERAIAKISALFGTSQFLYLQLLFFLAWISLSHLLADSTLPFDFPKFDLRNQGLDTAALLIATGVLVHQTRQEKLAEQRSHLMLQINLLTEQKIAKLIGLVEELRADLPNVRKRSDWEANIMQQSIDPQVVLNILQENLEQSLDSDAPDLSQE